MRVFACLVCSVVYGGGPGPRNVAVIANSNSLVSGQIADYYAAKRGIPARNVCTIKTAKEETISREIYERDIAKPVASCLRSRGLVEQVLYLVTTLGVPLRIEGTPNLNPTDGASVDSELALLYEDIKGIKRTLSGPADNPFFRQSDTAFTHPHFPMYLVTRLAAYDVYTVKKMIDRALVAKNEGRFVLDLKSNEDRAGNDWLRNAAILLPADRTVFDETNTVLYDQKRVLGYAGWGSNDLHRKRRWVNFEWLPGAIATAFVSTDGRTFVRPPENWTIGSWSDNPKTWHAGSPQSLAADYLAEGATGASGHVAEPYLAMAPRPDFLFPAYLAGRNLAESFWLSIPVLSWQNIVLGDPLCALR